MRKVKSSWCHVGDTKREEQGKGSDELRVELPGKKGVD